ncbi:MAG TPA: flippase [Algoriphagus sp.]|jgi:PST family polysaccharide transporter|uniref:oligosaccharide flippase family protein n=1 Tax=Algoriphagus TaxID=246875 RepID=UPI000C515125|nr:MULTISPECIES: oligosaccharide flippase family protein [Algoriphagus]MAL12073.1 flippase [Algoriphagus sp.]HAD50600.1 flippase [Algoriphagus sp.]HAS57547.1 flippase [Algoriphagus sp.]HCB45123.1 flippase [Algoriphagus sp.]HCD88150.1 flippase [Algoriphagus sp.]|tara:strand:+ start:15171 stop:16460 length:1290 start_codon:yes stop_codon:yes gene_type:complete
MFEKLTLLPLSNFIRNKSIQNFLFLGIIQSSNVLISIISMPLLIQSIGVDQFGLVNLALSVIVIMNVLVVYGFNLSAPREVAVSQQDKEALSHLVSNVFSGKIILAAIATILILVGAFGFNLFQEYQLILVFSSLLLFSEATLPLWFFQGMEKMKLVSIANIFSKLLFLMGIVLFIHRPEQSHWVNFMLGLFGLIINILLIFYINRVFGIKIIKPEWSEILKSYIQNFLLFLSSATSFISTNGGLIILSFFSVAETLGMYSLAERVVMVLRLFPALIIQAIFPNASKLYQADPVRFYKFLKNVYLRVLLAGIFISAGTHFAAPWIIQVLSRSDLQESVMYLKILAAVPFLACLNVGNVTLLLVADLKELLFKASWMMCVYMIIVSAILTYYFGGIGLCFGIISTEIIVFLICLVLLYRHEKNLVHGFYS